MKKINGHKRRKCHGNEFTKRCTLTLPTGLMEFADERARVEHCNNLASYVRSLIMDDARKVGHRTAG